MTEPYSPQQYQLNTWLGFEAMWKGDVPEPRDAGPPPPPHPNEVATSESVQADIYSAEDVGTEH